MALQLKKQTAKIAHLNVREEKHGEESVLACDVKLKMDLGNEVLDTLAQGLRQALYRPDDGQLEGIEAPMSVLRFPALGGQHWTVEVRTVKFTLHGAKKADDMVFEGSISKAISLDPKEGGTVEVTLQVQLNPEPGELAGLSSLLGKSAKISLAPGAIHADDDGAGEDTGEGGGDTVAGAGTAAAGAGQEPAEWPFPKAVH